MLQSSSEDYTRTRKIAPIVPNAEQIQRSEEQRRQVEQPASGLEMKFEFGARDFWTHAKPRPLDIFDCLIGRT